MRSSLLSLLSTPPPSVAVEIAGGRVTGVALARGGGRPAVAGHAIEPLPDGAVVPALNAANIHDPSAVALALQRAFDRLGMRPRRVGLIVPDGAAKVSLVRFDRVPPRAADLEQLVRWQVRKAAPFRIEDAQVSFVPGAAREGGGREFIVTAMRRDIVEEYERVCAAAGAHAGTVDLATFNLVNVVLAGEGGSPGGDWLLVHLTPDDASMAILRGRDLIFFRNRPAEGEGSPADLVHQAAMYYQDRLGGGGFSRVLMAGGSADGPDSAEGRRPVPLRRALEERIGVRVEPVDPREAAALTDRIAAGPGLLDAIAPALGLLLRERAPAAA